MKKRLPLLMLLACCFSLFIISCKKTDLAPVKEPVAQAKPGAGSEDDGSSNRTYFSNCEETITALVAGQTIPAGTVTVWNDSTTIYVTYTTANGYLLTQTHLYVGNCAAIPVTNNGNPIPGAFPYSSEHARVTSYTYEVPMSLIGEGNCGCIAAHAVVIKLDASGNVIDSQTAWGDGQRFVNRGNWATKFPYCVCL